MKYVDDFRDKSLARRLAAGRSRRRCAPTANTV
jgi:hypothetical protein